MTPKKSHCSACDAGVPVINRHELVQVDENGIPTGTTLMYRCPGEGCAVCRTRIHTFKTVTDPGIDPRKTPPCTHCGAANWSLCTLGCSGWWWD